MVPKRNLEKAKLWRKGSQERHRLEIFTIEYMKVKHPRIMIDIKTMYERISSRYPTRRKLTVTPDFLSWKKDIEATTSTSASLTPAVVIPTVTTSASSSLTPAPVIPTVTTSTLQTVTTETISTSTDLNLGATETINNETNLAIDAEIENLV